MSNKMKRKPVIRRTCRKCGARLLNKPEYGAVCPKCGWMRKWYTDKEVEVKYGQQTNEQ